MNLRLQIPRFAASTVEDKTKQGSPVLDGRDVIVPNHWKLPPHTVALVGRPAVWFAFDLLRWHVERDIGGHLYLLVTGADASHATLVEAGPRNPNGTGPLVPFTYPEVAFAEQNKADFAPQIIAPPHGMTPEFFGEMVRARHRDYDGDQRYRAIEIPFLRVGRDSNSYVVGVLLACGVDPRAITLVPQNAKHRELTGYPGAEDPVPKANFGVYLGAPTELSAGATEIAYHGPDGGVLAVVVGGAPNATMRLTDTTEVTLDAHGRMAFAPDDARAHGMPGRHTEPPEHIRKRRRFPDVPEAAGGLIGLVLDGTSIPLAPGKAFRGTVVARNDGLGIATLKTRDGMCVLPIVDLGVELRDPKRVDDLFRVGNDLTVGVHRDRHPRLVAHGANFFRDRLTWRRFHAPRPAAIALALSAGAAAIGIGIVLARRR